MLDIMPGEWGGYDDVARYLELLVNNMNMIPVPVQVLDDDDNPVDMPYGHVMIWCIMYMSCYDHVSEIWWVIWCIVLITSLFIMSQHLCKLLSTHLFYSGNRP